jgi:hypothetical protein
MAVTGETGYLTEIYLKSVLSLKHTTRALFRANGEKKILHNVSPDTVYYPEKIINNHSKDQ